MRGYTLFFSFFYLAESRVEILKGEFRPETGYTEYPELNASLGSFTTTTNNT